MLAARIDSGQGPRRIAGASPSPAFNFNKQQPTGRDAIVKSLPFFRGTTGGAASICLIVLLFAGGLFADGIAADADWQFDQIRLTNGAVLKGLILEETPNGIRFENVRRHPGRLTVVFTTTFTKAEIAGIDRLAAADRDRLRGRLRELAEAGPAEKQREERLELEPMVWAGRAGAGRRYRSEFFVLESNAPESVVRSAAIRLEQVFAAYVRYLPPRTIGRRPTTIELFQSRAGYEARLAAEGLEFVNVACYDPAANRILCYSDMEQLGANLQRLREEHQQIRADLDKDEKEFSRLYRGADLARVIGIIRSTRKRLNAADHQNEGSFDEATRQMFAVLGHEAFHAYLANMVYPPPDPGPPRWLNEGLAQIFETAVVEAGELRVGHADKDRLARVKDAIRKRELAPLNRLLRSVPRDFLAVHAADRLASDMNYLTAWALAFHLTFERRLLGTTFLDRYFQVLAKGTDPVEAFADLVGQPLPAYEVAFRQYLLQLQPDGTIAAGPRPEK